MSGVDAEGNQMMPPLEEVDLAPDRNASKRSSVNASILSAKIRSATEKGDNGEDPYVQALLDDLMDAVGTVENGREMVLNYFRNASAEPSNPAVPDSR